MVLDCLVFSESSRQEFSTRASAPASPAGYNRPPTGNDSKISRWPGVSLGATNSPDCMYWNILLEAVKALFRQEGDSGANPMSNFATRLDNWSGGTVGSIRTRERSSGGTWNSTQSRISADAAAR